ncbi:CHASE3 domain-containing protein [Mucilaginibacter sp. UC70_90]
MPGIFMRLNFTRNLQLGYGFSILILLIVGFFSYNTINNLLNSNKAVGHSTLVIQKLEQAISSMKDAETGQRGFLLTGKTSFLGPYKGAYLKTQGLISEVDALTAGNTLQQANLAGIRAILTRRMAILEQLVSKKQHQQAVSTADLEEGRSAMDALRLAVDHAEDTERKLLDETQGSFGTLYLCCSGSHNRNAHTRRCDRFIIIYQCNSRREGKRPPAAGTGGQRTGNRGF